MQVGNSLADKVKSTPTNADKSARQTACNEFFSERQSAKKSKKPGLCPGELSLAVSAPGYKELRGAAGAFWLEPAVEEKQKAKLGVQAWLETVKLAPIRRPTRNLKSRRRLYFLRSHWQSLLSPLQEPRSRSPCI